MFGGILETAYVDGFLEFHVLAVILFMTNNGCGNKRNVYKLSVIIKKISVKHVGKKFILSTENDVDFQIVHYMKKQSKNTVHRRKYWRKAV